MPSGFWPWKGTVLRYFGLYGALIALMQIDRNFSLMWDFEKRTEA